MTPGAGAMSENLGTRLDAIMADLDRTGAAWVAAGYPDSGPEAEAREAVFTRLRQWNQDAGVSR